MSRPSTDHPSPETLAAFVDGKLSDHVAVEAHIDHCDDCAVAVLTTQRINLLALHGLIPPLKEQRVTEAPNTERLGSTANPERVNPKPTPAPSKATWSIGGLLALGGLGGTHALASTFGGPKPILAGSGDAAHGPTPADHPHDSTHHDSYGHDAAVTSDADSQHHQHSLHHDVIPADWRPSETDMDHGIVIDDATAFLHHVQELLGDGVSTSLDAHDHPFTADSHIEDPHCDAGHHSSGETEHNRVSSDAGEGHFIPFEFSQDDHSLDGHIDANTHDEQHHDDHQDYDHHGDEH